MPLSVIFQLYHGDQFQWWKKPEYPERTTDHGQATGKPYHLWLRVEWYLKKKLEYGEEVLWVKSLYLEKKMVSGEETSIWGDEVGI